MYLFWPGKPFYAEFATHSLTTGAAADADSLPTATVARNGAADALVTALVTDIGTGEYAVSFTVPAGYSVYDAVTVRVNALMGGVPVKLRINAYCPVPPDVAGMTWDRWARAAGSELFGLATPAGPQMGFATPNGEASHTVTYGDADGQRIGTTFP